MVEVIISVMGEQRSFWWIPRYGWDAADAATYLDKCLTSTWPLLDLDRQFTGNCSWRLYHQEKQIGYAVFINKVC